MQCCHGSSVLGGPPPPQGYPPNYPNRQVMMMNYRQMMYSRPPHPRPTLSTPSNNSRASRSPHFSQADQIEAATKKKIR